MPAAHTLSSAPLPRSILPLHLQARQQQRKRDSCILYTSKDEQLQQIILLHLSPVRSYCITMRFTSDLLFTLISSRSFSSWPFPHQPVKSTGSLLHLPHPKHNNPPTSLHLWSSLAVAHVARWERSSPQFPLCIPPPSMLNMLVATPWPILVPCHRLKASPDHLPLLCNTKICLLLAWLYTH